MKTQFFGLQMDIWAYLIFYKNKKIKAPQDLVRQSSNFKSSRLKIKNSQKENTT